LNENQKEASKDRMKRVVLQAKPLLKDIYIYIYRGFNMERDIVCVCFFNNKGTLKNEFFLLHFLSYCYIVENFVLNKRIFEKFKILF
jgi:hypothetical protein